MYRGAVASLVALAQVTGTWAKTVTYNWEVTWVSASPDGFTRPVIGINGRWPCPTIEADVGDTVVVNMKNKLGNQTTGIHFHGINQMGTPFMDGAAMVNQCPTPPEHSITYSFQADAPDHSHDMGQYPDGFRGPLIIHDPKDPFKGQYDEEVVLTISDWYHQQTIPLVQKMLMKNNTKFQPPLPDSQLINDGKSADIKMEIGKTYRIRIISFAAFASAMVHFDSHNMNVIMIDSSYVQKQEVSQLRVSPAQRYDVLISGSAKDKGQNFPYLVALDANRDFTQPALQPTGVLSWAHNATGYLVTDDKLPKNRIDVISMFQPFDEGRFVPYNKLPALGPVTKVWKLDFDFCTDVNGYPRSCFNGKTYIGQKTPTLYSAATLGNLNTNTDLYGQVNAFTVAYGDIVEIVINNHDPAIHPFHMHGHQFQVLERAQSNAGPWTGSDSTANLLPPTRDTVSVNGNSYAVLRFKADNPGVFLFHCHIEWHVEMGLTATLIEAPEKLHDLKIPSDHLDACKAQGIPIAGNAAGNSANPLDTTGFVTVAPTEYYGATYPSPAGSVTARRRAVAVRQIRRKPSGQTAW